MIIVGLLYRYDSNISNEILWIGCGIICGIWLLETSPYKREIILTLSISRLGIQRSTTSNGDSIKYEPLIPREAIHDCILLEHIETFSVETHIVFRLKQQQQQKQNTTSSTDNNHQPLIPILAFPNTTMKFRQCQSLLSQIQQALKET